jgi:hypothetical protein
MGDVPRGTNPSVVSFGAQLQIGTRPRNLNPAQRIQEVFHRENVSPVLTPLL